MATAAKRRSKVAPGECNEPGETNQYITQATQWRPFHVEPPLRGLYYVSKLLPPGFPLVIRATVVHRFTVRTSRLKGDYYDFLFLFAAPFLAAVDLLAAFRLRVAQAFFAAAEREAVVRFAGLVAVRLVVRLAAVRLVVVLLRVVVRDFIADPVFFALFTAAAFLAPRFDGVVSRFFPRPEPLFLPPPSCAFTVA